jgi:hypothetical protein
MSNISSATSIFPFFFHPQTGQRIWLTGVENRKDPRRDKLILTPLMDDDYRVAKSFRYDFCVRMRERFSEDLPPQYDLHFTLSPGDTTEEVGRASSTSAPDRDGRQVMMYRGLLVHPGWNTRQNCPCWFVKFPGHSIESISGDTPETAVNIAYERNLQNKAEQAPPPQPEPEPVVTKQFNGRVRPGDVR